MIKPIHITITGDLGSGKSTIAKLLCDTLHFQYFSTGNIQRELSQKEGINTLEMNYLAEKNEAIDKYIDNLTAEINNETTAYVLDSRMAWHFIQKSFKIYLTVDVEEAAKRIMQDKTRSSEPTAIDILEKIHNLNERKSAERKRFLAKYNVDYFDRNNYDLVYDTTQKSTEEIVKEIILRYQNFVNNAQA